MSGVQEHRFQGIGVSPGIACGRVQVNSGSVLSPKKYTVPDHLVARERERLEQALVQTRQQICDLQAQVLQRSGAESAGIFEAHLLVLEDHHALEKVTKMVADANVNVEFALWEVLQNYIENLRGLEDPYLRERSVDLEDVLQRILRNLSSEGPIAPEENKHPHILVSNDVTPSEFATLDEKVLGLATIAGSHTSHTAIMARAMDLPAVVGVHGLEGRLADGDEVLIDGYQGLLILHPTKATKHGYERFEEAQSDLRTELSALSSQGAETIDGFRVTLSCNIEFAAELPRVHKVGAEGVGLYRTEFFYLNQQTLPTEEQLYTDYAKVIEGGGEAGVIIRTLDAGGDKIAGGIYQEAEPNPFLGLRGIRLCLERKDWFRTQLRAILRASTKGKVSIMFPLICGLDDFREARSCLEEARAELLKEGIAVSEDMEVGVMIEVPSAVVLAPRLAQEADFLSVGTNDLVQYTLAVDRCNERVSHLFSCHHPAILDSLHHVVSAAEGGEAWAGVCGEMAGDAVSIPLLIGLGFTELSVAPSQVLATKYAIRHLSKRECEALVAECQKCDTAEDIRSRCLHFAAERYGKLLEAPESV